MSAEGTILENRRGSPGSVVLVVLGSLIGLLAFALLAGGGGVLWADKTQRDAAGYFTTSTHRLATDTYALSKVGVEVNDVFFHPGKVATVRVRATAASPERAIFVGIAGRARSTAISRASRTRSSTSTTGLSRSTTLGPASPPILPRGTSGRSRRPGPGHRPSRCWCGRGTGRSSS